MPRSGFSPFHDRSLESGASGFSLVELSIVLVILGLLTGGILTGQNLIRAAELRSVITEFKNYQTAAMTFQEQYFALPGDMTNATDFWGEMTNCGAASPSGTGTQTCNGDGDGFIEAAGALSRTGEMFAFWQQLAAAGVIEGAYNGIAGSGSALNGIVGTNIPRSKIGNAGWTVYYLGNVTNVSSAIYEGAYDNAFYLGVQGTGSASNPFLTPEEAWNIDTKMDDGKPGIGKLRTFESQGRADGTGCTDMAASNSSDIADSVNYELSNTNIACALNFPSVF